MYQECESCKYINECEEHKKHPQMVACCEFGALDENGNLIEEED